jgi:hypothetical protein
MQRNVNSDLSPYILCLFLLGLPPGVISLDRPLSPNSLISALLRAFGSTAASIVFERSLLAPLSTVVLLSIRRFSVAGGGVIARGGVLTGGVFSALLLFEICALTNAVLEASSVAPILAWVWSELLTLVETIMMRGFTKGNAVSD